MVVVKCLGRRIRVKYLAGLCLGFAIGILFVNLVLGKHSMIYKEGFEAGIQYEKQMRKQFADSIRNNCTWNNGVPVTAITTSDSVLEDNFPKPNMNKLLKGE